MNETYVWVRTGDACEYEKFDDIIDATDHLKEAGVKCRIYWGDHGKLFAPGFAGDNHISFFWGNKNGDFVRDLNADEKKEVEREIEVFTDPQGAGHQADVEIRHLPCPVPPGLLGA